MPRSSPSPIEAAIDRLYQLPLDEFVAARNTLARDSEGADAARVRALAKPNVVAWALNQLYWNARPTFDRLIAAAASLRGAQASALLGKPADLRAAAAEHRDALRAALEETTSVLERAGHPATPDTIRSLTAAFEALPWKEQAGRLTRPPAAPGFEAFAGMAIAEPVQRQSEPAARKKEKKEGTARQGAGTQNAHAREAELDARRQAERRAELERAESRRKAIAEANTRVEASAAALATAQAAAQQAAEQLAAARQAVREAEAAHRQAERDLQKAERG